MFGCYLREWLRVLHRGRGGRGDHCGGGAELRVLAAAAHRARTAGAPIAAAQQICKLRDTSPESQAISSPIAYDIACPAIKVLFTYPRLAVPDLKYLICT